MNENLLPLCIAMPVIGGVLAWCIGRKSERIRDIFVLIIALIQFILVITVVCQSTNLNIVEWNYAGFIGDGIHLSLSNFGRVHIVLTAFAWLFSTVYSLEHCQDIKCKNAYYLFLFITLGATTGVFLAKDLFTVFLFFELMSLASVMWVLQRRTPKAIHSAKVYLAISVVAGMSILMGLFLLYSQTGGFLLAEANVSDITYYMIIGCLIAGFGAKAGMFLLHIWLPGAYTQTLASETALLSGILSKTGLYGVIIVSANILGGHAYIGISLLIVGCMTILVGSIYAIASIDVKRILAFSSMAQMGFMIVGISTVIYLGVEQELLELRGEVIKATVLLMFNHSLAKLALFLILGSAAMAAGSYNLNHIRGSARKNILFHMTYVIIFFTLIGLPGFGGFLSKTLIHEGILEAQYMSVMAHTLLSYAEWIFILGSALTTAYLLKIYVVLFWGIGDKECKKDTWGTNICLVVISSILLFVGCNIHYIEGLGEYMSDIYESNLIFHEKNYFIFENMKYSFLALAIGLIIYFVVIRNWGRVSTKEGKEYRSMVPIWMDSGELIYIPLFVKVLPMLGTLIARIADSIIDAIIVGLRKTIFKDAKIPKELEEGNIVTYQLGRLVDFIDKVNAKMQRKELKAPGYFVHKFAIIYDEWSENSFLITRGMSFGLLLFSMGLCITLIYILFI